MVIYVWADGRWEYSWNCLTRPADAKAVNLDTWYEYNLTELEVLACLEALEE